MSNPERSKRPYNSNRRKAQARQTRLLIIAAARQLFFQNGYAGTTIEAIAGQAGVAPETVYSVFGNKLAILSALVDVSVVGDDEPIPLLQRPDIQAARQETDPHHLLQKFARDVYDVMQRMSPVFALLGATAKAEPEIATLRRRLLAERLQGMTFLVEMLARIAPLRPEITSERAAETVWALSSAEVFQLLTIERGWSQAQYIDWLVDALERLLLA